MQVELSQLWQNLHQLSTAMPAMSKHLGVMQQRRQASVALNPADLPYTKLSEVLERRIRHLHEIGAEVVDEMEGKAPRSSRLGVKIVDEVSQFNADGFCTKVARAAPFTTRAAEPRAGVSMARAEEPVAEQTKRRKTEDDARP